MSCLTLLGQRIKSFQMVFYIGFKSKSPVHKLFPNDNEINLLQNKLLSKANNRLGCLYIGLPGVEQTRKIGFTRKWPARNPLMPILFITTTDLTIAAQMTMSLSSSWVSTPALAANACKMFRWPWIVLRIDICRFASFASSLVRASSLCFSSSSVFESSSLRSLSSKVNFLRRENAFIT